MSKCLVRGSINPYLNPRMIFSSNYDGVFFQKFYVAPAPSRDLYVLRDTGNEVQLLMMICYHDTLLIYITNRHVFCLLLIYFKI
jgi:hypothetical protein